LTPYLATNTEEHALTTIYFNAAMLVVAVIMMLCVKTKTAKEIEEQNMENKFNISVDKIEGVENR